MPIPEKKEKPPQALPRKGRGVGPRAYTKPKVERDTFSERSYKSELSYDSSCSVLSGASPSKKEINPRKDPFGFVHSENGRKVTANYKRLSLFKMARKLKFGVGLLLDKWTKLSEKARALRTLLYVLCLEVPSKEDLWSKTRDFIQKRKGHLRCPERFMRTLLHI